MGKHLLTTFRHRALLSFFSSSGYLKLINVLCICRYCVLGLSATIGDTFFKCVDANYVAVALMENLQSMEFRHMRQLIHSFVIYAVKSCPADMWEPWLEVLLHPLLIHCQQATSSSWPSLMREGRAKVSDYFNIFEVMEEKLLWDLTREIASLLSTMASPGLNPGLPILEHSGHVGRVDVSTLKDLLAFKSNSMVGYVYCSLFSSSFLGYFLMKGELTMYRVLQFPPKPQKCCSPSTADLFGSVFMDRWGSNHQSLLLLWCCNPSSDSNK